MNNIEVHIDFSCPFSYIGGERMIQFLESKQAELTKVRFRSFQLNPQKDTTHTDFLQNMSKKFGLGTVKETKARYSGIVQAAASLGLHYDLDTIVDTNSIHAHMGLQYATIHNKQAQYFRKVMAGHFEQGKDFYQLAFIYQVLTDLGLNAKDFEVKQEEMRQLVKEDISLAAKRRVQSVPTFYQEGIVLQGTGSFEEFETFM
ncbi:MAG: hypothetical protein GX786_05075 [Clostridiales bacterium]|nr:hypothetical protein [Clostridiales bacterium]